MKVYSRVWLTSFGDLLTLLLCFAVVAIYRSAQDASLNSQSNQIVSEIGRSSKDKSVATGKQIASKQVTEFPHFALSLAKDDFRPSFVGLNEAGSSKLRKFLGQHKGSLEIGVCEVGFDYSQAAFETLSNELAYRSLRFLMGAAVCKSLEQQENRNAEEVILVRVKAEDNHG